ncbi:MAG: hypothetical protein ACRD2H_14605 [Terriglobales bacterium]
MEPMPSLAGLLQRAANPAAAERALDRFLQAAGAATLARLRAHPRQLQPLLVIFGHSQFLAEALIQNPELADWLEQARQQDRILQPEELAADLAEQAAPARPEERPLTLVRWKKRELLRIALRDLTGQATLAETTLELSNLADALLARAYSWAWNDLVARFGTPMAGEEASREVAGLAILGLGKLGGEELNYSSDIDLMFLYSAEGRTDGHGAAGPTSNREFFVRLAQETVRHVSTPTAEGMAYRVDLRLRPAGREGEIALPREQALAYYRREARPWELQMLIKARPCAGQRELGKAFLTELTECIYPPLAGAEVIAAVRETRERVRERLHGDRSRRRRSADLDVKLDRGGIRDIEFLTQGVQRRFGGRDPWLRAANTLQALQRLHDKGHLDGQQFQALSSAYSLLRHVEHRLQLRLGQQTHVVPSEPEALRMLAQGMRRALRFDQSQPTNGAADEPWLLAELQRAMNQVAALFEELLPAPAAGGGEFRLRSDLPVHGASPARRLDHLRRQLAPQLSPRGRHQWERLLASLAGHEQAAESFGRWPTAVLDRLVAILNTSEFLVDALALRPQGWECLLDPLPPPDERQLPLLPGEGAGPGAALASQVLGAGESLGERMRRLRLLYQGRLCQYVAGELAAPGAIRPTLRRLTDWAEAAIQGALLVAAEARKADPRRIAVLALGRLGMREFDLLSDADLVFVAEPENLDSATQVATTMLEVLTSYTQEGIVFPVDARLRPEGTQGELVHTPNGLREYFYARANAWEAASYLKLRAVAGHRGLADTVASRIRQAIACRFSDWRMYRTELGAMRSRIEHEQRPGQGPFKTGPGGSFDFDFILSSIALESGLADLTCQDLATAFHSLAEHDRGFLPPPLARELSRLAGQLRAADHVLRIVTGKAPRGTALADAAANPAARLWAGMMRQPLAGETFAAAVDAALRRVREIYDHVMR